MLLYYGEKLPETLVTTTVTTSVLSIDSCLLSDGVDVPDETKLSGGFISLTDTTQSSVHKESGSEV